jgi:hypothetical protein
MGCNHGDFINCFILTLIGISFLLLYSWYSRKKLEKLYKENDKLYSKEVPYKIEPQMKKN